ncbi:MAG: hypothetical protein HZA74_01265 [Ignavibacteriales bacterium]|nr:hypothetical protein [Ignavibacteriales bacterium]
MKVLFSANVSHTGISIQKVIDEIQKKVEIDVFYISFHLWYGVREKKYYDSVIFNKYTIKNPALSDYVLWNKSKITNTFFKHFRDIEKEFEKHLDEINPDILITADDQGFLELFLMQKCYERGVKIILLEHGFGYVAQNLSSGWIDKAKRFYSDLRLKNRIENYFPIEPFGLKFSNKIFCYSGFTYSIHKKNKFLSSKIILTGFPYFDLVYDYLYKEVLFPYSINPKSHCSKKILFISSGSSYYYGFNNASFLINEIINYLIKVVDFNFEFVIRPKYGEDIQDYKKIIDNNKNKKTNIYLQDSDNLSFYFLRDFDLVIGESSTVLLEAVLFKIPIILIENLKLKLFKKYDEILIKNKLTPIIISGNNIKFDIKYAFSDEYKKDIYKRLFENEYYYFYKFDGKCSTRIAERILNDN